MVFSSSTKTAVFSNVRNSFPPFLFLLMGFTLDLNCLLLDISFHGRCVRFGHDTIFAPLYNSEYEACGCILGR